MRNFTLVATFICLWLSRFFNLEFQEIIAYLFILTVGVLHGANDLAILKVVAGKNGQKYKFYKVLLVYVSIVVGVLLVFLWNAKLALPLFILLSAYHFGEQHLRIYSKKSTYLNTIYFMSYGCLILFIIFLIKYNKVVQVIYEVSSFSISENHLLIGFFLSAILFLIISGINYLKGTLTINIFKELLYLGILFIVFDSASLVWGFAIYFVFWHSIPSIADQVEFLYGKLNLKTVFAYFRSSWMYWAVSLIGLGLLFLAFKSNTDHLLTILICFLAAITLPHVLVMTRLEINENNETL